MLKPSLIAKTDPKANESQTVTIDSLRITYLTSRLIRVEEEPFCDLASQTVWFRKFEPGKMDVKKRGGKIYVETEDVIFKISRGIPVSAKFKDTGKEESFDREDNLGGTVRTLDQTVGPVDIGEGFITKGGVYLLDDSKTMLIDENGRFIPRENSSKDFYAFAYGKDYRGTINAFYKISSKTPLIPRYALGVWWSRYHIYTQKEYLDLMARFKKEGIPLTVATIDMDWHWVRGIKERFGVDYGGWTGYSWDTTLFPDYKAMFRQLKDDNLHITLNLHPADGIHCYEDMYEEMAKATGVDPKSKKKVEFQCANDDFWNAYFDIIHKPYERDGVDFWWIDWQQGVNSDLKGLDPLTALNHYHTLDNAEDGRMPMILSRYAGYGSHRYPLGFSGDTEMSWDVLNFQPYFTSTATNVAYTWWSHDIGGHHKGYRDDDLYLRWVELSVFLPILRLHSTEKDFLGKEPWKYRFDVFEYAKKQLRLRHKLIPYIFTMDYATHEKGLALCEPMYYSYPDKKEAYNVPNQYMFGSELMVCPITSPNNKEVQMGSVEAWIPEGRWVDMFTGKAYEGEQKITLFRDLRSIPVLAKEGAIIPMSADEGNKCDNPKSFDILAFSGNGSFTMIEDNSKTDYADHRTETKFDIAYQNNKVTFTIHKAEGDLSVISEKRDYRITVKDLFVDGENVVFEVKDAPVTEDYVFVSENAKRAEAPDIKDVLVDVFSRWQETTKNKERFYDRIKNITSKDELFAEMKKMNKKNKKAEKNKDKKMNMPDSVMKVIFEELA